ncbi:MAG: RNA export factor gle2, partial [Watsoniomyces obsoletus]
IEGRCAIQYVEERDSANNFSFKCHRETPTSGPNKDVSNVYSVNAISFHPEHGTFSTAGSDGTFHFWDGQAKHRLKGYPNVGGPITATGFNRQGTVFAYAISYDWSQGFQKNTQQTPNKVMLHGVMPDEMERAKVDETDITNERRRPPSDQGVLGNEPETSSVIYHTLARDCDVIRPRGQQ